MKKIVVVSTYPEHGSKNIGDQLITDSLIGIVTELCEARVDVVWRADSWENVKDKLVTADHVFFACLAIRPFMHEKEYPFLQNIIDSGVGFSAIAAGTDLPVATDRIFEGFSAETLTALKTLNERASVFTTRGVLTQEFCRFLALDNACFSGDVAFFDRRFDGCNFSRDRAIKKIVISDPHRGRSYIDSFVALYEGVRDLFPGAELVVALHGENLIIESLCLERSIKYSRIYEDRHGGLDIYDDTDLHVGFRVHAHVSALKRRVYSYLLEQDGRGCDYGLTIDRRISIPNYCYSTPYVTLRNLIRRLSGRKMDGKGKASDSPARQMVALIRRDAADGFNKFLGVEKSVMEFSDLNRNAIKKALLIS